jgi:FkbM family methyltransferase
MMKRPFCLCRDHNSRRVRVSLLRLVSLILGAPPPGMGQHALARYLQRRYLTTFDAPITQRLVKGPRLELRPSEPVEGETLLLRRYSPDLVATILDRLPRNGVFFDVGANVGLVTFSVAARRPEAMIRAFEPLPENVSRWERNWELNPSAVTSLEPLAVGSRSGTAELVLGTDAGGGYLAHDPEKPTITVQLVTLDDYSDQHGFERIDVMKLDVEGGEAQALRGARRLLEGGRIETLLCEVNDLALERAGSSRQELLDLVSPYGYSPAPLRPVGIHRFRRAPETDLMFVRESF